MFYPYRQTKRTCPECKKHKLLESWLDWFCDKCFYKKSKTKKVIKEQNSKQKRKSWGYEL